LRGTKKLLAVFLTIAILVSSITPVLAEGTISKEAQICYDLGILKGDEGGFNAMTEVIREQHRLPSAIFACNDMIALGVMEAIKAAGLSIPQDISVIGCDDIDQSKYFSPKLTTIKVNTELMAKVACQNLFLSIENQEILNIQIILPTKLIIRESTALCSIN